MNVYNIKKVKISTHANKHAALISMKFIRSGSLIWRSHLHTTTTTTMVPTIDNLIP